jgi:hypothetical protein
MATLTETAYYARKTLAIGGILLAAFIVLRISLNLAIKVWHRLHPAPPPKPTVSFGKIPQPVFPESNASGFTFKLETIEGKLPNLGNIGKVYLMPKETPTFLTLDRAKEKASTLGFRGEAEAISQNLYRWRNGSTTLEMDILTGNFKLRYPYKDDQSLLVNKNLPSSQQAIQEAKSFLGGRNLLGKDVSAGTGETIYLRFVPPDLVPAISLSEADFIRVNLFRADLDKMKILPPNPKHSLISFLFSGSREGGKRIVEIDYNYFPIEQEISATYPLRSVETAWQELQAGEGYIANPPETGGTSPIIRKVYLAYYDSASSQNYLQPIYVFEGDDEFMAYTAALDPKWLE